ncbi:helix-turn-helix transcriptional regulator [Specibacter sp. RAF43]|uniref:helix-turn-helix transcriptional regulator n=1 Tax=Specibacter sp. RAF43 TaxID=3233057 RepID=UPI003F948AF0
MSTNIDTTERLLNLVIALLGTRRGYSKHYIRNNIFGYAPAASDDAKAERAFERMFERDKEALRRLGIPITAVTNYDLDAESQTYYRINPADYQVPQVRLDGPAMTMLAVAANLWAGAAFGAAAQSALRKIATGTGTGWYDDDTTVQARIRTQEPAFEPLWEALRNSQGVTFSYRAAEAAADTDRTVQPWGLGNKYGQWYLYGFDVARAQTRAFRLSRITSPVTVLAQQTFARPADFSITDVLDALGTGPSQTALLRVPAHAAHALRNREGAAVVDAGPSGTDILSVPYREPELMADDLAAMGAHAVVLEPAALRAAVRSRLAAAAAAAEASLPDPARLDFSPSSTAALSSPGARKDAREHLVRLLSMVPYLVANQGVELQEIAAEFGITLDQVERDLALLSVCGLPGYLHGDLMDVVADSGQVFIRDAETLARPLRLTQEEACALLVGLEALRAVPGTREAQSVATALESVRTVAGDSAWLADAVALRLASGPVLELAARLQGCIQERRAVSITYLVRSRDELTRRVIEPRRILSIDSTWYVRAWCRSAQAMRNFRVDGIRALADAGAVDEAKPGLREPLPAGAAPGLYTPGEKDRAVVLAMDAATAQRLGPSYGAAVAVLPDGRSALRFLVGDAGTIPPLLARLGGRAQLVEPADIRDRTRRWLADALGEYDPRQDATHPTPNGTGTGATQTPRFDG